MDVNAMGPVVGWFKFASTPVVIQINCTNFSLDRRKLYACPSLLLDNRHNTFPSLELEADHSHPSSA
jgi:hypothetical protein